MYKGKEERKEWRPPLHFGVAAIKKGAFGSTRVTNFTYYFYIHRYNLEAIPHETTTVRPLTSHHIQVRRVRHAGHCWRSKKEPIRDVLRWTPTQGRVSAGRPTRTYFQQLYADIGFSLRDLLKAMNDRDGWKERV